MIDARSRLIVALDLPDRENALEMTRRLQGCAGWVKVGLQLFVAEGPRLIEELRAMGPSVFLDLKLHDIPNTVAGAVRSACRLGVGMLTLHASGGPKMLQAARAAAAESAAPPLLLAVTVLTSLNSEDCEAVGVDTTPAQWVRRLAEMAHGAGLRGMVASPLEAPLLRRAFGSSVQLVIPGIRPAASAAQDQSRTAAPADAIRAGADYLVVGRPILQAPDPAAAADAVVAAMAQGFAGSR